MNEIFPEENTTTEFMCKVIHNDLIQRLKGKCYKGSNLSVKLFESHKAWASYHSKGKAGYWFDSFSSLMIL